MEKEKKELDVPLIVLSILGIFTLGLVISFIYFSLNGHDYSEVYSSEVEPGKRKNTTDFGIIDNANLSYSQEEMVRHMAIVLKLYNLHEIPYTKITPKIQVSIDEDFYFIEIIKGDIIIKRGEVSEEDINIKTSLDEMVKMKEDENYAKESISSGKTTVEKVAEDFTLFSKGYLDLYQELNLK